VEENQGWWNSWLNLLEKTKKGEKMGAKKIKTKIYTVPERNWILQAGRGFWVGSVFRHHGVDMKVVEVGKVYRRGKESLIGIKAVAISNSTRKTGSAYQREVK
jgi:hypothetical protein